jgi:hypothetical protein
LIALAYSAAGTGILAVAVRRKQRFFLFPGVVLIAAGIASSTGTTF